MSVTQFPRSSSPPPGRWLRFALVPVALLGCDADADRDRSSSDDRWVVQAARIYVDPESPPIEGGWVLVTAGRVDAVGTASELPPEGVRLDAGCSGGVVVAGFQNGHVHFSAPAFEGAATRSAEELEEALVQMLTGFGFTTVVDTGSIVGNTVALRERIDRGEVRGPSIRTAGLPLFPVDGIPSYLRELPAEILEQLPQPATGVEAASVVAQNFALGANGTKLFVATPRGGGAIARMPVEIGRVAAEETHRRGGLVMAHPTDAEGLRDAVAAGVDIVAHTTIDPAGSGWSDEVIGEMVARGVSVIPTLKLWGYELERQGSPVEAREGAVDDATREVGAFAAAGGQLLFGTDVGYMGDFDPTEEYALMARAGLSTRQILASLTTAPAARWHEGDRRGRVAPGFTADLVVLDADPATDVRNFARVRCTIREGHALFRRDRSPSAGASPGE